MLSERNECPALFLDLGEAFRGVFSRLKLKLGDAKKRSFQGQFPNNIPSSGLKDWLQERQEWVIKKISSCKGASNKSLTNLL